jgi:hypothetical protein
MTSQAAVPELDLSVTINSGVYEFAAEANLNLEASKKYVFGLAPGLDVDAAYVDAVAVPTVQPKAHIKLYLCVQFISKPC